LTQLVEKNRMLFRHYKGGLYVHLGEAIREGSGDHFTIYQAVDGPSPGKVFCRPFVEFFGTVDNPDNPGAPVRRFQSVGTLP
jgi:hypothetical protein